MGKGRPEVVERVVIHRVGELIIKKLYTIFVPVVLGRRTFSFKVQVVRDF